jgi:thiamine biosynthesis lipoprotein
LIPRPAIQRKSGIISVTVITNSSLDADALATSIFVLGVEEGLKLANELNEARVMIITEDKEIYFSNNSRNQVSEIHSGYHVAN